MSRRRRECRCSQSHDHCCGCFYVVVASDGVLDSVQDFVVEVSGGFGFVTIDENNTITPSHTHTRQ